MLYDVCVIGGCSMDFEYFQNVDGSYNDSPNLKVPGGKGANQAVAASRAGAKTTIITRIGKDDIGREIFDNLSINNVNTSHVEIEEGLNNDYSNIFINLKDKDNQIERHSGAINSFTPDMIDKYKDVILNSKIIVCQLKVPKEVTERLIEFCGEYNKILILTPCRPEKLSISDEKNKNLIDKISIITCNKHECQTIFNTTDIESCVKQYPNKLIVTLGSEGLMYYNGERVIKMPALKCNVLDTTGAGDTLNGNLAALLAGGCDLQHALRKSMYASTMKLQQKSAQTGMPYKDELENFISLYRTKDFEYNKELNLSITLVKSAYEKIKYSTNFKVRSKSDASLVTDSDLLIDKYLVSKIKETFSGDYFVTEESFPEGKILDRTWIIDPIDGTSHYLKDDDLWGIQLAFYDKGATRFSVIYLAAKDELYYAVKNNGAYLNNHKILPVDISPVNQAIVEFGGSILKEFETKKSLFEKLKVENRLAVANILHINSCCIAYTNLVTGKTDALISSVNSKLKPWDTMPGEFLCNECGFELTYLDANKTSKLITANKDLQNLILN